MYWIILCIIQNLGWFCSTFLWYNLMYLISLTWFVFLFFPFFIHPPTTHHPSSSSPVSYFISNFDEHIFCSESPSVPVWPTAMVLFITVSSLPWALRVLRASPSCNDQMWPGPWSLCQQRTGGQPQLVGIPHTREGQKKARERGGGGMWRGLCVDGV